MNADAKTKQAWAKTFADIELNEVMGIFNHRRVRSTLEWLVTQLPRGASILEGGCGLGQFVWYFKKHGFYICGMDYNRETIEKGKAFFSNELGTDLDLFVGNVESIPFGNNTFSAHLSFGVLEHFKEGPEVAIDEAWRTLRPGGRYYVFVPQCTLAMKVTWPYRLLSRSNWLRRLLGKAARQYYWEQYFHRKDIVGKLRDGGFKIISVIPQDYDHSVLTAFPFCRDKSVYEGITPLGEAIADWCGRWMKWSMNAQLCIVAEKPHEA